MDQDSSMSFQKIVLITAVVILVITLTVIGYMMYYAEQSKTYPPSYSACPDLWDLSGANICTNTALSSGYFNNIGSFITDVSCGLTGSTGSPNLCSDITNWSPESGSLCASNWVQGNSANGLDNTNCYLLASQGTTAITTKSGISPVKTYKVPNTVSHKLVSSLGDNVSWARTYGIAWDGLN